MNSKLPYLILVVISSMANSFAFTQDDKPTHDACTVSATESLIFGVGENFTLGSFSGSSIAYQKNVSNKKVIRLSMSVDSENYDYRSTIDQYENENDFYYNDTEIETNTTHIDITFLMLRYSEPNGKISRYLGLGPHVDIYQRIHSDTEYAHNDWMPEESEYNYSTDELHYGLGVTAVLGIEWFINPQISFLAEYSQSLTLNKIEDNIESSSYNDTEQETRINDISFTDNPVRMGISFYFK